MAFDTLADVITRLQRLDEMQRTYRIRDAVELIDECREKLEELRDKLYL